MNTEWGRGALRPISLALKMLNYLESPAEGGGGA